MFVAALHLGRPPPGSGARALRAPAARHLLALDHRLLRRARRAHLHRPRGHARPRPAARLVARLSAPTPHPRSRAASSSTTRRSGNLEELADLYLEDGKFAHARELYDAVISPRTTSLDPFYRRGIAAMEIGDFAAAVADLTHVVSADPQYDFHRAVGLLAHACAQAGDPSAPRRGSSRRPPSRRCPRPTATTPRFCLRRGGRPKRASGRGVCSPRSRPCPAICAGASVPGFGRRRGF